MAEGKVRSLETEVYFLNTTVGLCQEFRLMILIEMYVSVIIMQEKMSRVCPNKLLTVVIFPK